MTEEALRGFWIVWLIFSFLFTLLSVMAQRFRGVALAAVITLIFVLIAPVEQIAVAGQGVLFIVLAVSLVIADKTLMEKIQESRTPTSGEQLRAGDAVEDVPALKADKPVGLSGDEL
jgi:membrane protein implicated in regulation of membrane protease activity